MNNTRLYCAKCNQLIAEATTDNPIVPMRIQHVGACPKPKRVK